MTDLTAITNPFGLLDRETQEALKAHGGPYEVFDGPNNRFGCWASAPIPSWIFEDTYRVKPAPPKPREWWCVGKHMRDSPEDAQAFLDQLEVDYPKMDFGPIIHVREVLP